MSLLTQTFNASNQSLSFSQGMLLQQNYEAQRSLIGDAYEQEDVLIDYSVEENRLYENFDGTIAIAEKPLGYVIGEQIIAPMIDNISSAVKYIFNFGAKSCAYVDRMLTFPSAYADQGCAPVTDCNHRHFETRVEKKWVKGPIYNKKVANTGRDSQKVIYNPPDGWAIMNHRTNEHVKFGHSGYTVSLVAGGSRFASRQEIESRFDGEIKWSDGEKKQHLIAKKNAYLREYQQIDASHQTLILDATAEGVGYFQGGGRLHVEVEVELVRFFYEETIDEISSICDISNANFKKDSCYAISYDSDYDGQKGWLLSAHRAFGKDRRNDDSTYAIIHKPGYPSHVWKIITEDSGKTFQIFLANNAGDGQVGWFLCAHGVYDKDKRNGGSSYALVHKPGYEIRHWKIINRGGTYTISLANNAYGQSGWFLSAHRHYDMDKRNDGSTYVMVHTPGFGGRDWKIEEVPC